MIRTRTDRSAKCAWLTPKPNQSQEPTHPLENPIWRLSSIRFDLFGDFQRFSLGPLADLSAAQCFHVQISSKKSTVRFQRQVPRLISVETSLVVIKMRRSRNLYLPFFSLLALVVTKLRLDCHPNNIFICRPVRFLRLLSTCKNSNAL